MSPDEMVFWWTGFKIVPINGKGGWGKVPGKPIVNIKFLKN